MGTKTGVKATAKKTSIRSPYAVEDKIKKNVLKKAIDMDRDNDKEKEKGKKNSKENKKSKSDKDTAQGKNKSSSTSSTSTSTTVRKQATSEVMGNGEKTKRIARTNSRSTTTSTI